MLTPEEFNAEMERLYETEFGDPENFHIAADGLMMLVLEQHGYTEGVRFFKYKEKWYA